MKEKKEKTNKERKDKELRPAARYSFAAVFFVLILLFLIVFHFLLRSGRIEYKETYSSTLLRLKSAYRESSSVVEAFCLYSYKEKSGEGYSCYEVRRVLSGENKELTDDSLINVKTLDNAGERHLLYLSGPYEDSEKGLVYEVVNDNNYLIKKEGIVVDGKSAVPIEKLIEEIKEIRSEIMLPYNYSYFRSIKNLVKNCDLILIGRVESISDEGRVKCMISSNGEKQEMLIGVRKIQISVLNNLESDVRYGQKIEIIMTEKDALQTLDYMTGKSVSSYKENDPLEEDDVCVFFLKACEDSKENIYFFINDFQGYIKTSGDSVFPCSSNAPFSSITSLYGAVEAVMNEKHSK